MAFKARLNFLGKLYKMLCFGFSRNCLVDARGKPSSNVYVDISPDKKLTATYRYKPVVVLAPIDDWLKRL